MPDGVAERARGTRHRRGRRSAALGALHGRPDEELAADALAVPRGRLAAIDEPARDRRRCRAHAGGGRAFGIDPSLARGLSYYTGAIMEMAVPDLAGSLGGGGRYDNLIGMFLGRDVPACGFSLGLERIIVVMTERGMFPATSSRGARRRDGDALDDASRGERSRWRANSRRRPRVDVYPESPTSSGSSSSTRRAAQVPVRGDRRATMNWRDGSGDACKDMRHAAQAAVPRARVAEHRRRLQLAETGRTSRE